MESLCYSANKESEVAYDVSTSLTEAKAVWAMMAARGREDEFYEPAREDNILGGNQTRLELWEEYLKDPIFALNKSFEVLGESVSRLTVGSRHFVESWFFNGPRPRGLRHGAKHVGHTDVGT